MSLTDILEITGLAVGTGVFGLALNELRKQYVSGAEKNKFYDENVLKKDMKDGNQVNYNLLYKTAGFYKPFKDMINAARLKK